MRDRSDRYSVESARAAFPIGTHVRYYPVLRGEVFVRAVIRSEPWALGHGAVVIKITGRAGGVATEHLERIAQ